jgi:lipopolysaccharide/colanic/teichoic acid biosynthesis glycosyltransferase
MLAHSSLNTTLDSITLKPGYLRAKRLLDIGITLLLSPLLVVVMALVALAIFLDSPGPIFFRQTRIGQHGKAFTLLKFRSMAASNDDTLHRTAIRQFMQGQQLHQQANNANRYKLATDQRITRIGRFIRQTSFDELPQFFNVLRGEMSLVGPRPPLSYEVELYSPRDRLRLSGKPGLTGLWQVYGRSRVPFSVMVEMDIAYLQKPSLLQDLRLIILTIPVMLYGRGGA